MRKRSKGQTVTLSLTNDQLYAMGLNYVDVRIQYSGRLHRPTLDRADSSTSADTWANLR